MLASEPVIVSFLFSIFFKLSIQSNGFHYGISHTYMPMCTHVHTHKITITLGSYHLPQPSSINVHLIHPFKGFLLCLHDTHIHCLLFSSTTFSLWMSSSSFIVCVYVSSILDYFYERKYDICLFFVWLILLHIMVSGPFIFPNRPCFILLFWLNKISLFTCATFSLSFALTGVCWFCILVWWLVQELDMVVYTLLWHVDLVIFSVHPQKWHNWIIQ